MNNNYLYILIFGCQFFIYNLDAQIGGKHSYEFLNLPASARQTALGGHIVSVMDEDVTIAGSNPASLNGKMNNRISFSHNFHFAGVQNGYFGYGKEISKWKLNTHFAIQYINYGEFTYTDVLGNQQDKFSVKETAIIIGAGKKIADRLYAGINLKTVFSNPESYSSIGALMDMGINYRNDSSNFIITFLVKNVGYELTTYTGERSGTPLDIQIGLSKKLKYLPFRFSVIAQQLQTANVRYDDPNKKVQTDIFGDPVTVSSFAESVDNIFRHLVFSGEFMLGKNENLRLRAGYNHLLRKELSVSTFRSLAGFSLGFGIKVNVFKLDYGVGYHHVAGATNHISISTDLGKFFKNI
ncbi:MAG: type IX secretion system protein PorQ [Saprospiraceae bacterium]|jgi:hypothetical protein